MATRSLSVYLGADHRGFAYKEHFKEILAAGGYAVTDKGNSVYDKGDDYVDFAAAVGRDVAADAERRRGVLFCGSGAGMTIAANKINGIRSIIGVSKEQVAASRNDDDINVLSVDVNFVNEGEAAAMIEAFLETPFSNEERHVRRIEKVRKLEAHD